MALKELMNLLDSQKIATKLTKCSSKRSGYWM